MTGLKTVCTGYENQGICSMCAGELPKRRRSYCSEACADLYVSLFFWGQAYRDAKERANHKCQRCGITERGIYKLVYPHWEIAGLEVHHIIPLNGAFRAWSPLNMPWNLRALCHECHLFVGSKKHTPEYKQGVLEL